MSVILQSKSFTNAKEQRVQERIQAELTIDDITIEHGLSLIMIVGEGHAICRRPGRPGL